MSTQPAKRPVLRVGNVVAKRETTQTADRNESNVIETLSIVARRGRKTKSNGRAERNAKKD